MAWSKAPNPLELELNNQRVINLHWIKSGLQLWSVPFACCHHIMKCHNLSPSDGKRMCHQIVQHAVKISQESIEIYGPVFYLIPRWLAILCSLAESRIHRCFHETCLSQRSALFYSDHATLPAHFISLWSVKNSVDVADPLHRSDPMPLYNISMSTLLHFIPLNTLCTEARCGFIWAFFDALEPWD